MRIVAYEGMSLARRRLLHRRVAERLAARARRDPANAALAAHHYREAGLDAEAAEQYLRAAEYARRLFANTEAVSHFQAALALGHPEAARLHRAIGDLHALQGSYRSALESYETAASLAEASELPLIEHGLGTVHHRLGNWDLAERHLDAALQRIPDGEDPGLRARVLADRSLTARQRGDPESAAALAREALASAETAGDDAALAQAHNILGILATGAGELAGARSHLERSLVLAADLADPSARVAALNNLSLAMRRAGENDEALVLARRALELCRAQGDRHREAALHNNIADLLHRLGRSEEAMDHLKAAVTIFREIGEEAGGLQPEIWKLVEW
jgi:tetratricopeptide (TPR) repeat protein